MKDFIFILISMSMTLLFAVAYFFNKGFQTSKGPRITLTLNVLLGLIFGAIIIGNDLIFKNNYSTDSQLSFFSLSIPVIIAASLFTKPETSILTSLSYLIYFVSIEDPNADLIMYILNILIIISLTIFTIAVRYAKKKKQRSEFIYTTIIYSTILIFWSVILIIINAIDGKNNPAEFLASWTWYTRFIVEFVLLTMITGMFVGVNKFYSHTIDLSKYSVFEYESFYRLSLVTETINGFATSNNISKGFVVIFRMDIEDEEEIKKYLNNLTRYIKNNIDKNTIFFKTTSQDWAFFIPIRQDISSLDEMIRGNKVIHRKETDPLKPIERAFEKVNATMQDRKVNVSAGVTIFGIQSEQIDSLVKKSDFMLRQQYVTVRENNILQMYDHKLFDKTNRINTGVRAVKKIVDLKNIEIKFVEVDNKEKETQVIKPVLGYVDESIFTSKLETDVQTLKKENLYPIYKRLLGRKILEEYKKQKRTEKILINYSTYQMIEKDYSVDNLKAKLKKLRIKQDRVIFMFNEKYDELWHDKVIDGIKTMRKSKLNIGLLNVSDDINEQILKDIKPKYLSINVDKVDTNVLIDLH